MATTKKVKSKAAVNVFEYVEDLPSIYKDRLYGLDEPGNGAESPHPWTCRAVFQSLPVLAKQYVMRLLAVDGPVSRQVVAEWIKPECIQKHQASIKKLQRLRILLEDDGNKNFGKGKSTNHKLSSPVYINPAFARNLRAALTHKCGQPWRHPDRAQPIDKDPPTLENLQKAMHVKWNSVLHFIVGMEDSPYDPPPPEVRKFLLSTGLMEEFKDESIGATDAGFEFLLKDIHVQVWMFVLEYIQTHEGHEIRRSDILNFLFQLSYCRAGEAYPVDALTDVQKQLLNDFSNFGLIYRPKKGPLFYPTTIAINLIFGSSTIRTPFMPSMVNLTDPEQIAVIVETNFQVIAYTRSPLHLAMLRIFVTLRIRLPNAAIGTLTQESIRYAMSFGITAKTILNFLASHAHPAVRGRKPIIPQNVTDQILLWERDRTRVKYQQGDMIDLSQEELSDEEFLEVMKYAEDLGVLFWSNEKQRLLVVSLTGSDRVRVFVERHKGR